MAHIRKTEAGTWQARYRAPDGWERPRNFTRKADAEAFLATVETDKLRGEWTDPRLARITFGEWNAKVQAGRVNLAASTRASDGSVIRSLVLPAFENAALSAIEPGGVRAWVADLIADGYSPSTIRRAYTLLQLALELAVEDGLLARSPCRRITLPRIEQSEKRFLSIEEVELLADSIRPRTEPSCSQAPTPACVPASWRPYLWIASTCFVVSSESKNRSRRLPLAGP